MSGELNVQNLDKSYRQCVGIYTSTGSFSLEGEACPEQCRRGWDEGDINGCFYSPLPNPLQQERELGQLITHCIYDTKSCVDSYAASGTARGFLACLWVFWRKMG